MSDTTPVPYNVLVGANSFEEGQPRCPSCFWGRLHPYRVTMPLSRADRALEDFLGADYLTGWVAVCVGNHSRNKDAEQRERGDLVEVNQAPCGFTMGMTSHRWDESGGSPP